jgi:hypothetical protein
MKKYIFYILDPNNNQVMGVISETGSQIVYDGLVAVPVFDNFQNKEVMQLQPYYDSPEREVNKGLLTENFGKVDVTKDYLQALCHATGKKKAAIAQNTES